MLDQIVAFVSKNKVMTAVAAAIVGLTLYAGQGQTGGVGVTGGGGSGGGGWGGGQGGGTTTHEVIDQTGFERPVRALTVPVPAGWQVQSNIRWNSVPGQCSSSVAAPHIRMNSPDGREQIEVLPGYIVTSDSSVITRTGAQPGDFCVVAIADSGESLVRNIVIPRIRAGARVDRVVSVQLTPQQQALKAQLDQLSAASGNMRAEVYSMEAWLTHPDGTAEVLLLAGYLFASPQLIAGVPPLVTNNNDSVISVRGSPQRIEALLQTTRAIIAGAQFDPAWKAQIEETQRIVSTPVNTRGRGGGGGGGGFDMDRWREEQRRDDRAQRDRIDSIREVERCYDPETGTVVEVSIHIGC
jgi:hypothetical protein